MVVRVLMLLFAFILFVNLCIITISTITNENLYKKYGKQLIYIFGAFVLMVAALYLAVALIGLK
jgi:Na+/melibiose symporter-like transporter